MATRWTDADAEAVKEAIASCALTVHFGGPPARTVTRHSLESMRELLAEIEAALGDEAGTRQRYRVASHNKGF